MPLPLEGRLYHACKSLLYRKTSDPSAADHRMALQTCLIDQVRLNELADAAADLFRSHFGEVSATSDDLDHWLRLSFVETRLVTYAISISNGS